MDEIKRLFKGKHRNDNYNHEIERMFKYRNDSNLMDCISPIEDCCCRVFYSSMDFKIPFCDFPNTCARLLINKEKEVLDELVNKICKERKSEATYWNFVKRDQ